jgi:SSS family solute:Na+ symporter
LTLATLDWIVIAGYIVIILGVGLAVMRRANRGTDDYFLTGRSLPWWIAGTSMVATSFSVDTPLLVTGWVRTGGIQQNWVWWSLAFSGMVSVFALSRLWRRARIVTDVELTELRYSGRSAQWLRGFRGFWLAIPVNVIAMALVLRAMGKVAEAVLGMPQTLTLPVIAGVAFVYALFAGLWGVVITDFVQFFIAMGGAIVFSVFAVQHVGGISKMLDALPDRTVLNFFPHLQHGTPFWSGEFWTPALMALAVYSLIQWWAYLNSDGGGKIIQRMSASKDERHSLWAVLWFNIAHYVIRPWPWILVALASLVVYPEMADPEMAYPRLMTDVLPAGWLGLMIAGFLAAFMSTIDTQLNWGSSYLINDIYRRFLVKDAPDRHYLWVSKGSVLLLSLLTVGVALIIDSVRGAFMFILAFGAGTGAVYILRWFWWRINAWTEISAMIASTAISSTLYLLNKYAGAGVSHPAIISITAFGSATIWLTVTFLTRPEPMDHLGTFYRRTRPWGAWGPVAARMSTSLRASTRGEALRVVTWCVLGSVGLFGLLFGIGKLLLGDPRLGIAMLVVAGACWIALILTGGLSGQFAQHSASDA